jgi:pimeloyl-ACP methyl ester carboxylesterase
MYHITSNDGTQIAVQHSGSGPALLLAHGELADRFYWERLLPYLDPFFSIYSMDRRGHGDSSPYLPGNRPEREVEDLRAVISSIPGQVDLLGSSLAARLCLLAAVDNPSVRRLVLIESKGQTSSAAAFFSEHVQDCDSIRDRECIVLNAMRALSQNESGPAARSDEELRRSPLFDAGMRNAFSIPVELASFDLSPAEPFPPALNNPILLAVGSLSGEAARQEAERLASALPGSKLRVLVGLDGDSIVTAPAVLAEEIKAFLL